MARSASVKIKYSGSSSSVSSISDGSASGSAASSSSSSGGTYTVKKGDCLWSISKQYYGSGAKYTIIYEANKAIIEEVAKKHGYSSSSNGHWIWAGTVLTIPDIDDSEQQSVKSGEIIGSSTTKKTDMGESISELTQSFSYTDESTGKSDSVSITLMNIGKEWLKDKMPERGATLTATIKTKDWGQGKASFSCGTFILDDISFSGRPLDCTLSAVSVPVNVDFKAKTKTVTWQETTLKDIAEKIASAAGVKLYYSGGSVKISEDEQNKKTDSAYLYSLCDKYGFSMKVYNQKIVIFDTVAAEAKDSVLELGEADLLNWSYNTTLEGTYTGIEFTYTNPDTKDKNNRTIKVTLGKAGRIYYANAQASSKYDAELQAKALLNKANREIETMNITIRANNTLVASQCITITGLGKASGRYYIDKIKHELGSGYKMKLDLHKVGPVPKKKTSTTGTTTDTGESDSGSGTNTSSGAGDYVVKRGDCLWSIARQFYGSGAKYTIIYEANKDVIENVAKKHGYASSDNGYWIWAGTVLKIPKLEE